MATELRAIGIRHWPFIISHFNNKWRMRNASCTMAQPHKRAGHLSNKTLVADNQPIRREPSATCNH